MLKIIRIEHPSDGKGFWHSRNDIGICRREFHSEDERICARHGNFLEFPTYWEDYELRAQRDDDDHELSEYNFAYNSLDQLATGFTRGEIQECIVDLGFRVLMYTVDKDYFQSEYQVIFIKSSAVSVEDISSLFL